jgi:alkylation response protein AidB-like acyl-CoA dehydrogenase
MDFKLSKEQQMIKQMARDFSQRKLVPIADKIDATHEIPAEIITELGELGLLALPISAQYGGAEAGYDGYVLAMEEITQVVGSVQLLIAAHVLGMSILETFGTEEQREKYLPTGITGEKIFSFAFTEPGTGSDPKQITATARKDGDNWILNGTKRFISNANLPGMMGCVFKEEESGKLVTFLIEKGKVEGYSISEPWDKMAWNGQPLYDIYFKNCIVPEANMLGKIGDGFSQLESGIGYGKMGLASASLGISQAAYDLSVQYATEKLHRGKPILKFQAIQLMIAEMAQKLEASMLMLYKCASDANFNSKHSPVKFAKDAAMAKDFCGAMAVDITRLAMNVHGSYGLMKDYKVEKLYREAIMSPQIEGVPHIQKIIIANAIAQGY